MRRSRAVRFMWSRQFRHRWRTSKNVMHRSPPVVEMQAPQSPPLAAPGTPPMPADYADLVSRGRSFMSDWTPSPKSQASIAVYGAQERS